MFSTKFGKFMVIIFQYFFLSCIGISHGSSRETVGYIIRYVSNRIWVCKTFLLQGILPSVTVGANEASLKLRGQAVRKGDWGFWGRN